jgi:hypothetical protein
MIVVRFALSCAVWDQWFSVLLLKIRTAQCEVEKCLRSQADRPQHVYSIADKMPEVSCNCSLRRRLELN